MHEQYWSENLNAKIHLTDLTRRLESSIKRDGSNVGHSDIEENFCEIWKGPVTGFPK